MGSKYQNGKIYKIVDVGYNKCYIGSTCEALSQRMARHRKDYRRFQRQQRNYVSIFDLFDEYGVENCKIELIEECDCNNVYELRRQEGQHIQTTECLNKIVAGRTRKDRYEENKDAYLAQCKAYRDTHKEERQRYYKAYREENRERIYKITNCDCGGTYTHDHKARHFRTARHQKYVEQQEQEMEKI